METDPAAEGLTGPGGGRSRGPRGIASIVLDQDVPPLDFVFLGLPGASMLAFTSAIEPLRILNQLAGRPIANWRVVTTDGDPLTFSCGLSLLADGVAGDLSRNDRLFVCSGAEPERSLSTRAVAMARRAWRHGHEVGGICTGAYTLAEAGILEGRRFTLHWENTEAFELTYPHLRSTRQLFARDDKILTCAGGTAATDMMLSILRDHCGALAANLVMDMCLHPAMRAPEEAQKTSLAFTLGVRNERFLALLQDMEDSDNWFFTMDALSERHAMSRRQIERLFKKYTGCSPQNYARYRRLDYARLQLATTNLAIQDIATACGFESAGVFSRNFKKRFGITPFAYSMKRGI